MAIRFHEADARPMGRATSGVRGINLSRGDIVVGMVVLSRPDTTLLVLTEGGMGKRTDVEAYRFQQRGGKGVINIKTSEKTGKVVAIKSVIDEDELMIITRNGVVNRQRVSEIRTIGRATQGVRLVNLDSGDRVMDVARVIRENGAEEEDGLVGSEELEGVAEEEVLPGGRREGETVGMLESADGSSGDSFGPEEGYGDGDAEEGDQDA